MYATERKPRASRNKKGQAAYRSTRGRPNRYMEAVVILSNVEIKIANRAKRLVMFWLGLAGGFAVVAGAASTPWALDAYHSLRCKALERLCPPTYVRDAPPKKPTSSKSGVG